MKRRSFIYLFVICLLLVVFPALPAQSAPQAAPTRSYADTDGDGLSDSLETGGWCNAAGCFKTDPNKPDSDGDGLTDGEEQLFDSNPLDDTNPGIYVKYEDGYQTRRYPDWQQFGQNYIVLPVSGWNNVVVRRGTTFSVGGPATAQLNVSKSKSYLTSLSYARNPATGRWDVSVPSWGTVGVYYLTMYEGNWSKSLNLDVIFELPTDVSPAFVDSFVYDDNPNSIRDTTSIGYFELQVPSYTEYEYTHDDFSWIPYGEWVTHGYGWNFDTKHYQDFLFQSRVMWTINGATSTWSAANSLTKLADNSTCFGLARPLGDSWSVLYPPNHDNRNQCTNIANLLVAFNRAAGIPARDVWADWIHNSFDHSTEIWTKEPWGGTLGWHVARGYNQDEYENPASQHCKSASFSGGVVSLRNTSGYYTEWNNQGVYAAGENWNWADIDGDGVNADDYRMASWDFNRSAQTAKLAKKDWWETRFRAYWGWSSEPTVIGSPPGAWPSPPTSAPIVNSAPSLLAGPTSGQSVTGTQPIKILQVAADSGVDTDKDGRFNQLVLKIQVDVAKAGRYWFDGRLSGTQVEAVGSADLTVGPHVVELPFSGWDIYMSKVDGPYLLQGLWVTDVADPRPEDFANKSVDHLMSRYKTRAYRYAEFGLAGAALAGPITHRQVDTNGDGYADAMVVETKLRIDKPGTYTVESALDPGKGTPITATWTGTGDQVSLRFDGLRDKSGPFSLLSLSVSDAAQQVTDGLNAPLALGTISEFSAKPILLGAQAASRSNPALPAPNVAITGTGYSDRAVDTNGDGRYDQLIVTVAVEVEPGKGGQAYRADGWLTDSNGSLVAYAITAPQILPVGVTNLSLIFDGGIIYEHGADGPFKLTSVRALKGATYEVLNKVDVAYTTGNYNHNSFKGSLISPAIEVLADRVENGANQWSADSIWTLDGDTSFSYSHSWMASSSGSESGSLTRSLDLSNYAKPVLRFKTGYAMESSDDLGAVQLSSDGINWTRVVTFTNSTPSWTIVSLDLSPWAKTPNVRLRFNADSQSGLLWYIDDIYLDAWPAVASASFTYGPRPVQVGQDITFTAVYTSVNRSLPITYNWNFGDGSAPVATQTPMVVHRFLTAGDFTIQLAVDNPYDRQTSSQFIRIPQALTGISFRYVPVVPPPGEDITFTAVNIPPNASQPVTYTWDFGDGSSSIVTKDNSLTHKFANKGRYDISLTAVNDYGPPVTLRQAFVVGDGLFLPFVTR